MIALLRALFWYKSTFIPILGRVNPPDCLSFNMYYSWGSPMDKSRGFRHELQLRICKARFGTEPFRPLCNATNDLLLCAHCGKRAPTMKRCSGCRWARYCNRECQKANWQTHRDECCPDRSLPVGIRTIPYRIIGSSCVHHDRRLPR
jgi:hypothetical protein